MTSSNKIYSKSSKYTFFALILGCISLVGLGYLVLEVNKLDKEFGALIRDRAGYTERLEQVKKDLELTENAQNSAWTKRIILILKFKRKNLRPKDSRMK